MRKLRLLLLLPISLLFGVISTSNFNNEINVSYATYNDTANEFISYWRSEVRGKYPDICVMPKSEYDITYSRYISLNEGDKTIVDGTIDVENYTIKDSMRTLINKFNHQQNPQQVFTLNKGTTLSIIIGVGVLGMTAIAGFYYMKTKSIIE